MRIKKEFIKKVIGILSVIVCLAIDVLLNLLLMRLGRFFAVFSVISIAIQIVFFINMVIDTRYYDITYEEYIRRILDHVFEFDDNNENNVADSHKTDKQIKIKNNHKPICYTDFKPTKKSELNGRIPEKGEIIFRDEEDTKPYSRIIIGDGITAPDKLPILKPLLQPLTNTNIQRRYNYIDINGWWSQNQACTIPCQDSATTIIQESKTVQNEILNKQCSMSNTENIDYEQVKKNMEQLVSDLGTPEAMLLFMMIGYGVGQFLYGTHQSLMNSNHWSIM